jgi:hypothetical protein
MVGSHLAVRLSALAAKISLWMIIEFWVVEAHTFSAKSAFSLRWGYEPYAHAMTVTGPNI